MLKRKIEDTLLRWKQQTDKKVFMLIGARQVGKTSAIRAFAKRHYKNIAEINFLEDEKAESLLAESQNVDDFVSRFSLASTSEIIPGKTLIFLDEIQEAPSLITWLKFLVDSNKYDVVVSGSLLGTELKGIRSFPVGYVQIEYMFPLDFEEFAWAIKIPQGVLDTIQGAYEDKTPMPDVLHTRLISAYRYYIAVGGMPDVVNAYLKDFNISPARTAAQQIVEQYRFDILKYAANVGPAIKALYDAIPSQLNKENKRFEFAAVKKNAQFSRMEGAFAWLIDAGVALPAYRITEPKSPLEAKGQTSRFKLYMSDTGLLLSQYPQSTTLDLIAGAKNVNYGGVYENATAQALAFVKRPEHYYNNNRIGEVDFLIENKRGEIWPIEVKSGKDYKRHTALNSMLDAEKYDLESAFVLSEGNVQTAQRRGRPVYYLPLYMTYLLAAESSPAIDDILLAPPDFSEWG